MENITYRKILMDECIFVKMENVTRFMKQYSHICLVKNSHRIQDATLYGCEVFFQRGMKNALVDFIEYHKRLGDLKEWLYVSQSLQNIYIMQQNHMDCCFVNNGINDCMDVSCAHEIRDISNLQKILK